MSLQIVPYYGVHEKSGVMYLMQGRKGTNAIGLRDLPPFQVKLPNGSRHCNHQIALAAPVPNNYHWDFFLEILPDPLVQAMLPIPKSGNGAFFIEDSGMNLQILLLNLSKMSSPIYNVVTPIWTMTAQQMLAELQSTNIQPLVLTQVEPKHSELLALLGKQAHHLPRTVIFVGSPDVVVPPTVTRIKTKLCDGSRDPLDLSVLPYEALGAVVLRRYMRGEWPIKDKPRGFEANHQIVT